MKMKQLTFLISLACAGSAIAQSAVPPPVRKGGVTEAAQSDTSGASKITPKASSYTEVNPRLTETDKEHFDALKNGEGKAGKSSSTVVFTAAPSKDVAPSVQPVQQDDVPAVDYSKLPGGLDANDVRRRQEKARAEAEAKRKAQKATTPPPVSSDDNAAPPRASTKTNTVRTEVIETTVWPNSVVPGSNVLPPDGAMAKAVIGAANNSNGKPIVIDAIQGVNELVTIARGELNRFVTPFEKVKVRTAAGEEELVSKVDGNVVFIGSNKRAGVFLTEIGTDRAISLTLQPEDIPPRDIYLKLRRGEGIPSFAAKAVKASFGKSPGGFESYGQDRALPHVEVVKDLMRELALGKLPNGYSLMPFKPGEAYCAIPGFRVRLGQMIEGSTYKIAVFRAENHTGAPQQIDEQFCYRRGVVAVSAWPDVVVPPKSYTELFVMMRPQEAEPASSIRPSLLWTDPEKAKSLEVGDEQ
jgi:conjugal transfer pilus assembly protein TraK